MKKQLFGRLRLLIAPFESVIRLLPTRGRLLDVGCGHGFVTGMIASARPKLKIYGIAIDHYHLAPTQQDGIIDRSPALLSKNGVLIPKDIDIYPRYKYWWNYFHDCLMSKGNPIYCRSYRDWQKILKQKGFQIKKTFFSNKGWLYPHVIIIARKNAN